MKRRSLDVSAAEAGQKLEAFLSSKLGMAVADVRRLVEHGAVYVRGRRCKVSGGVLKAGDRVLVILEESGRGAMEAATPSAQPLAILFEDAHLIAVDKLAGLTAQPTAGRVGESLLDRVSQHLGKEAGLVHRLDRETSGVTVFGKTKQATSALAAQLREGSARKRYLAVCGPGLAASGTIDLPLSKDPSRPGRFRATRSANGVPAVTDFIRLAEAADHCLVSLFPRTGRTHQLRAHLTALGAPIAGDLRYGGQRDVAGHPAGRCLLHAQALRILHPATGSALCLEAELPADMRRVWDLDGVPMPKGTW
jgi:23S rRNA pseudouridine1911/1915/1917 synthase